MNAEYTRRAIVDSMPDEKISKNEVESAIRKAERRMRIAGNKFRFSYRDIEVVCVKMENCWLVITLYRKYG